MFANLVPAPYFVRAAELVLNLADVRSVGFDRAESGLRLAHVVYRNGMSDEFHGAAADALDRVFGAAQAVDAMALKVRTNPLVAVVPTWTEPCESEACRCPSNPTPAATR